VGAAVSEAPDTAAAARVQVSSVELLVVPLVRLLVTAPAAAVLRTMFSCLDVTVVS
jgi:hypothetical protein